MIAMWVIVPFFIGLLLLAVAIDSENFSTFLCSAALFLLVIYSLYLYNSSDFKDHVDTVHKVSIAENGIAYIYNDACAYNVNHIMDRNFKDGDEVIRRELKPYWAGHVYVEGKIKYLMKEGE